MDSAGRGGRRPQLGAVGRVVTVSSWSRRLARRLSTIRPDLSLALIETGLIALSYAAALSVRFVDAGEAFPTIWWARLAMFLPVIILVHLLLNIIFGNYGHVWSYASIEEAIRVIAAGTATGFVLIGILGLFRWLVSPVALVPLSVVILGVLFSLAGMGALRFWSRLFSNRRLNEHRRRLHRALVVGVGADAVHIARNQPDSMTAFNVVGFVDPGSGADRSRTLAGRPVLGTIEDVREILEAEKIDQIIIACSDADQISRRIVDICMDIDVNLKIFPAIDSVLADARGPRDIRDLELSDLLPRQQVTTDLSGVASFLDGRRVLVTGAGGSIGSEIVRQLLGFATAAVIAVDNDETHLHDAFVKWASAGETTSLTLELADIRDSRRVAAIFDEHKPHVIFHAAAHKHVPILEACPEEAIKTNVVGTANLVEAAAGNAATESFVLISTDKAVRPGSVMGASKRLAEMIIQHRDALSDGIRWSAVRFGNVLGSRGSVVPTFKRQVQAGGPVTVSHPDMERYFMTVDEAVELVLQAASISDGGEVFVLDMGSPVRIMDLAYRIIRLAGLVPGKDIEVEITGMRPGERLREELSIIPLSPSSHPKILLARPGVPLGTFMGGLTGTMVQLLDLDSVPRLREMLLELANDRWRELQVIDIAHIETENVAAIRTGS
jgi:FlaA1/EpsC-like NDP-sugar epimerase